MYKHDKKIKLSIVTVLTSVLIVFMLIVISSLLNLTDVYSTVNVNYDKLSLSNSNIVPVSDNSEKSDIFGYTISGNSTYYPHTPIEDFKEVKYISNENYFINNPQHAKNSRSDNPDGTCTTVAMQLLLGYHNYYSDRRIIPAVSNTGVRFLAEDYGDYDYDPSFTEDITIKQGCAQTGTEDAVYREIFDLIGVGDWRVIGQTIDMVTIGANKFLNKHTQDSARDGIKISSGFFSASTAREDIDEGNPIILGMQPITGDSFHVVVAYGYAKYNGENGFLVHYGWGDARTQVWIPENWCAFQIRMSVAHSHNLVDMGNLNDIYREFHCPECGYQTVKPLYTTNEEGNEITHVNFPLTGEIRIPAFINHVTITSIGPSAFANQPCENVIFPSYLTRIGVGAFDNCSNLISVTVSNRLSEIGNYAFKDCSALTTISPLTGLQTLGNKAFIGCNLLELEIPTGNRNFASENNILYNKSKTQIIASCKVANDLAIPASVTEIKDSAFEGNNNIFVLRFGNNSPTIGASAFAQCANLNTVYFDSFQVPTLSVNSFPNNDFILYTPYETRNTYRTVFSAYTNNFASILTKVRFVSEGETVDERDIYYGSIMDQLVTIEKKGYDFYGWYDNPEFVGSMYENGVLWEKQKDVTLYAKWTPKKFVISFRGSESSGLPQMSVTYDEPIGTLPTVSRNGYTFLGWKAENGEYYNGDIIWKELNNIILTSDWRANTYTVHFDGNGGITETDNFTAEFDSIVLNLPNCKRNGYQCVGWNTSADGSGETFSTPFIYHTSSDLTLYAQWEPEVYSITYHLNGGRLDGSYPSEYTIESDDITFGTPEKEGNEFVGWKSGNEIVAGIPSGSFGNVEVFADWNALQYTVTLDPNGGTIEGTNTFSVIYNSEFTTTARVSLSGNIFDGWYDENGVKYMTAEGDSTRLWDKPENTTLYAQWTIESYEIQISDKDTGKIIWLGPSNVPGDWELSETRSKIPYGTVLDAINLIARFKQSAYGYREGRIFDHFEFEGESPLEVDWSGVTDLGDDGVIITIIPKWIVENHKIVFKSLANDIDVNDVIADYDAAIQLPSITVAGKVFKGWYETPEGGTKINWTKMPDLTLGSQNNGSVTLYAQYDLIEYSVTYVLDGGSNSSENPSRYTIESNIRLLDGIRTGYIFDGWYSNAAKTVQVVEIKNMTEDITLYAKWTPISYYIQYNANGGTGSMENSKHDYDHIKNLSSNVFSKTGYHFTGWATTSSGNVIYSDSQAVNNLATAQNAVIELWANWMPNTYYVNYNANGGTGSMSQSEFTYDAEQELKANVFTKGQGYNFVGWAVKSEEAAIYADKEKVKNLTTTQFGIVTLYAKWKAKEYTITFDRQGGTGGADSTKATFMNRCRKLTPRQKTIMYFKAIIRGQTALASDITIRT